MANKLTIEQKLSQLFMTGIPGVEINDQLAAFMRDYQPGAILYFKHNFETPSLLTEFSNELQDLSIKATGLPLVIAVDHEGGKVNRFGKPFTQFPEAALLGDIGSPKTAFEVALVMSKELQSVGVNLNFWPLGDIHSRPSNPVIGRRAFGTEPDIVTKMSSAVIRGFITAKMFSSIKHFPGHGDTTVDSHDDLPKVSMSWDELKERELIPFNKAVKSKVDFIMTAHILNDKLDDVYPATLSYTTLTNHLRKELRYKGIIIADDMNMKAIADSFSKDDAVQLAFNAGCDMLIYRDIESTSAAIQAARKHLADGKISAERVEESYERVLEAKKRLLVPFQPTSLEGQAQLIGCEEHRQLADNIRHKKIDPANA